MAKYWGNKFLASGVSPEVGQKQKKKETRAKVGNNNGQLPSRPVQKSQKFSDPYTNKLKGCLFG